MNKILEDLMEEQGLDMAIGYAILNAVSKEDSKTLDDRVQDIIKGAARADSS